MPPPTPQVITLVCQVIRRTCVIATALALGAAWMQAQVTWIGGVGDDFSDTRNWLGGLLPANNGTARVQLAATAQNTAHLTSPLSLLALTFAGGPMTLTGNTITFGARGAATITALGNHPAAINNKIVLQDTTVFDARAGTISVGGDISGSGNLVKVGKGTLLLSGKNYYTGSTTISGGTLQLGATNTLPTTSPLILNGGMLALNGFSQTLGTLTVSTNSKIDFSGGGSSLAFANSSAIAWTGTLTITNYTSGSDSLRFGTTSSGLTTAQLALISFGNGTTAAIDALGYVTPSAIPEPGTYAAIVGALVLGLATYRRRRTKNRLHP